MKSIYLCIDLKTFFASVECVKRNLDPFQTNLVVADPSRGNGAICLAVSPKMKSLGVRNRCRIFEIPKEISYITALPRMKLYMETAAEIYGIYLKYIAKEDIHVYSIDEAFFDVSAYLKLYQVTAKQLARMMLDEVYKATGITATVGIGTNIYLAKVALDISAKHAEDNMAFLNERLYRETLWHHQPLTDFWQVGRGIQKRLAKYGILDMYDITQCDEEVLYHEFGVNAEYLIDHANGIEPTTISDIKKFQPKCNSMSNHQILFEPYAFDDAKLVVREMVELNCLRLVEQHVVTNQIFLYVGYDKDGVSSTGASKKLDVTTNSYQYLVDHFLSLYEENTHTFEPIKRIGIGFGHIMSEDHEAFDLFTDVEAMEEEKKLQQTLVSIKHKYGKNAILKGMNLFEHATTVQRNKLIGGHNAE